MKLKLPHLLIGLVIGIVLGVLLTLLIEHRSVFTKRLDISNNTEKVMQEWKIRLEKTREMRREANPSSQITGRDGSPMVLIPASEFQMGDAFNEGIMDDALPVHTVYLDAFYMDKYEVTNDRYARFLSSYGWHADTVGHLLINVSNSFASNIIQEGRIYKIIPGYEDHPVKVSWYGAAAYAQFYGKRLPTEAEWEKAARGGLVGKKYTWGNDITPNSKNYSSGRSVWSSPSPVGSFLPNNYGLFDIAGNVLEWCADIYHGGYYSVSSKDNPRGPGIPVLFRNDDFTRIDFSDRVVRGSDLRVAKRDHYPPEISPFGGTAGFRCVAGVSDIEIKSANMRKK